jgi:hypothetical protein
LALFGFFQKPKPVFQKPEHDKSPIRRAPPFDPRFSVFLRQPIRSLVERHVSRSASSKKTIHFNTSKLEYTQRINYEKYE